MGSDGQPYLMEINTLPGMNPVSSDLCIMARAEALAYDEMINEILYLAAERYGLKAPSYRPPLWSVGQDHLRPGGLTPPLLAPLTLGGVG